MDTILRSFSFNNFDETYDLPTFTVEKLTQNEDKELDKSEANEMVLMSKQGNDEIDDNFSAQSVGTQTEDIWCIPVSDRYKCPRPLSAQLLSQYQVRSIIIY